MSDRQSKNYDEATKAFFSCVAGRTRSKRDTYCEISADARGISSSSPRNVAGTDASCDSGGISAPIDRSNRKMIVGKLRGYSSSCNNVHDTDLVEVSARKRRRRNQFETMSRVCRGKINYGNKSADMDVKEIEIERIDEAEFKNKKIRSASKIERIDQAEFRNKKICSASRIGHSTRQESGEGFFAASSWKNVDIVTKKPSASLDFSIGDVSHASDQGLPVQKGNGTEDMDFEGIEIERIEEAEFMNLKTCLMSKIGSSSKEELNEGYSAVAPRKDASNGSRKAFSSDYCESFYPEDACHGSYHAWPQESSSFVQRGSDSEDMVPEETEIEIIDEAEFRSQKTHSESKIGRSMEQGLCAASSRNVDGASKNTSSADHSVSFSPRDYCTPADLLVDNSNPLAKKGNNDKPTRCREIKQIGEAEFKNGKSSITSKIGSSTRQRYSAANCRKKADIVKEVSFDNYCGSFSSEDAGKDSNKGQTEKSSSFAGKGNNNEDMDPENFGIEKIDESEFRNRKTRFVSKIGFSAKNVKSVSKKISSIGKIDKNKRKRKASSYSGRKKKDEACNRDLDDDVNSSSVECISSYSGSESDGDNINTSPQDDEISSYGAKHEMNLSIASRTRSKMGSIKKPAELGNVSLGSSLDLDSSSTDGGYYTSDDEYFEVESFDNFDGTELFSYVEACEVQDNRLMKVPAKEGEDCTKQEGSVAEHSPKRVHLNLQNKESNSRQPFFQKREFSSRKRQLSNDASSERTKGGKAHKICEVHEENEEILQKREFSSRKRQLSNDASSERTKGGKAHKTCKVHDENEEIHRTFSDDANAEEGSEERSNFPKFTRSKQSYAQNDCDEAKGVNGLHPKDQSQAGIRRQNNAASPSHSKDDCDHSNYDDIQEKTEATSSELHGHGETETVHVTDEIKEPTRKNQAASENYDFCSMLADAVLGKGPMLESKESDEEAKQASASQTQNSLPLKFRFEDEVPKEMEKTEHEKEIEGLFAELDFNWALEELGSFNYPQVDQETGNHPSEETHHARCAKGKHDLVFQEDQGLICIYCRHVELEPRHVLPEWVEKTYQDSERKRYSETEQFLEFDGLNLQSSINNIADFGKSANGTVWSIKPGIRESMYEHQQEGFEFLWKNLAGSINLDELKSIDPGEVGGCIISHAPGTGKTRLTIVFLETYLKMFPDCRPVIICPASMLLTWEEEFRKWNVEFPFVNLKNPEFLGKENKTVLGLLARAKGREKEAIIRMLKICSWSMGGSILGISYSLFEKLTGEKYIKEKTSKKSKTLEDQKEKMRRILLEKPGLVVLDEGHTPRNQRSNIWNVLLKLQTEKRVILSGTPFQNNFAELFNTLRIVRPAIADVLEQEKTLAEMITSRRMSSGRKYKREHSQSPLIPEVIDRAVEKLKISMAPFVHVHTGTILQESLPGLRDCVVLLKPPALQKSLIERLEGSPSTLEFEHKVALISVHPYLFQHFDSTEEQRIGIDMGAVEASKLNPNEGVKTKFILELVRLSMLMKEKVLIFSQYIHPLDLIKEQLKETFKWIDGKQILQLQGKLYHKHRQCLINIFNDPQSEAKIMLASTKCCSEGISLVGASRVVLLDVVWNPSVERQAICRAYRIGQKKFVYTYHLMTSGTTEADKYCRQTEKERISELVFSSNESNRQKHSSLGIEDRFLEEMVGHEKLKGMFEKIINQPKDTDLIQTFGLIS